VDDEELVSRAVARMLSGPRVAIVTLTSPVAALDALDREAFDVVLSDFGMPAMDGVDFLGEVRRRRPEIRRLMLTGNADHPKVKTALESGLAEHVLGKPATADSIRRALGLPTRASDP